MERKFLYFAGLEEMREDEMEEDTPLRNEAMPADPLGMKSLADENTRLRDEVRFLRNQLFAREQELAAPSSQQPADSSMVEQMRQLTMESNEEMERERLWSQDDNEDFTGSLKGRAELAELFKGNPCYLGKWASGAGLEW